MVQKFAHKTTTANMKRNALFFFLDKICKRLFVYVESLEHEYQRILYDFAQQQKKDDRIQNDSFFALSSPLKQTNKWSKKSKIEMHNVLARHKC